MLDSIQFCIARRQRDYLNRPTVGGEYQQFLTDGDSRLAHLISQRDAINQQLQLLPSHSSTPSKQKDSQRRRLSQAVRVSRAHLTPQRHSPSHSQDRQDAVVLAVAEAASSAIEKARKTLTPRSSERKREALKPRTYSSADKPVSKLFTDSGGSLLLGLGLIVENVTDLLGTKTQRGCRITGVIPSSPAARGQLSKISLF